MSLSIQPPLTRRERSSACRSAVFARYGEQGAVPSRLLRSTPTAASGVSSPDILKVDRLTTFGTPVEIINLFGGKKNYLAAIHELETELYLKAA